MVEDDVMATTRTWREMLYDLKTMGSSVSPTSPGADWKGRTTRELVAYRTFIPMSSPVVLSAARHHGFRYMVAEAAWILSGDNRVATIAPYSKRISRFSDDGVRFFGAYGPPFVEQVSYAVDALRKDPASRQAVIRIWRDQPRATRDTPCTLTWQYLIRGGALHMVASMRSSDAITGWPYDVFTFSMTAAAIAIELRATFADLRLGSLCLIAGSQHYYLADEDVVDAVLLEDSDVPERFRPGYAPLSLVEFDRAQDLTDRLWGLANGGRSGGWLADLCPAYATPRDN